MFRRGAVLGIGGEAGGTSSVLRRAVEMGLLGPAVTGVLGPGSAL